MDSFLKACYNLKFEILNVFELLFRGCFLCAVQYNRDLQLIKLDPDLKSLLIKGNFMRLNGSRTYCTYLGHGRR